MGLVTVVVCASISIVQRFLLAGDSLIQLRRTGTLHSLMKAL